MHAGKLVALTFAAVVLLAAGVVAVYKVEEARLPAIRMGFERIGPAANDTGAPPARLPLGPGNVSAPAPLPYKEVHAAYFLQDHLDEAARAGASSETIRLRVDLMRGTLADLTGNETGPWVVAWGGAAIRITLAESASPGGPGSLAGHVEPDANPAATLDAPSARPTS